MEHFSPALIQRHLRVEQDFWQVQEIATRVEVELWRAALAKVIVVARVSGVMPARGIPGTYAYIGHTWHHQIEIDLMILGGIGEIPH